MHFDIVMRTESMQLTHKTLQITCEFVSIKLSDIYLA